MAGNASALFDHLPTEAEYKARTEKFSKAFALFDTLPDEGQEAEGSFLPEAGKASAMGITSGVGATLKGISEGASADLYGRARNKVVQDVMDELHLDPMTQFTPEQSKQFAARVKEKMAAVQPEDFTKYKTYQAGKAIEQFGEEKFRAAKDYENGFTQTLFSGLAQTGLIAATAFVNPALATMGAMAQTTDQVVQDAVKNGATKEQIASATRQAFGPGASEIAPIEVLFSAVPAAKWGKLAGGLIKWGAVAAAEGTQEAMQQFWQNLIAKFNYKPDQDVSDGVAKAGGYGALIGLVFGAGGAYHDIRHGEEQPPPAGAPPPGAVPPGATPAETVLPPEEPQPGEPVTTPTEARLPPEEGVPTPPGYIRPEDLPPVEPAPAPPPAAAPSLAETILKPGVQQQVQNATVRPDSPRLTPGDRSSPIPNEMIDDGKRAVEAATGQESTVTTTMDVNGHRQVVDVPVSDLVAHDRAQTQALVDRITAGVSQPEILQETPQAAPPARETPLPGVETPAEAVAAPPPSPEPVSPAVAEARAAATAPSPDQLPAIEGAPMAKKGDTLADQIKKLKARSVAYDAQVEELASSGTSIKMVSNRDPTRKALIGPDISEPGMFRVTYIDKDGPSRHTVHRTMQEAARDVIGSYHPIGQIDRQVVRQDAAYTAGGREVPVTYAIVSADDLVTSQRDEGGANPAYPQELQPRDRSRGTSDQQISSIANNLNPALLDNNASASDGAPIVSADGVVESGNGRILAIRKAYNEGLPTAEAYKQYLADQGYFDVTASEGIKNPVLVRIRQGSLEPGERAAFTREANERTTLGMSAPERAMADAAAMSPEVVAAYRGGEISEAGNRDFVRSFMQAAVNPNDQATMVTPDGTLSQEGVRRVQGALLAKAYGDADLVGSLLESPDNNVKAIGGALMDVAGQWAQMRSEAKEGTINPEADATDAVLEAVRLVQRARNEGRPLSEFVAQKDIFSGRTISVEAEAVLRLLFRNTDSWTMPAGRAKIAEALGFYATEARKTTAGVDLLGETAPPPSKILETAKARQYGAEEAVQEKLALAGRATGPDTGAPSRGRSVEAQPRAQPEGRPSPAAKARKKPSKLKAKAAAKRKAAAPKTSLVNRLNELRRQLGYPEMTEKMAAKRSVGVVEANIKLLEAEAREKAKPVAKFSLAERVAQPGKVTIVSKLKEAVERMAAKRRAVLEERLNTKEIRDAIARMDAVPRTDLQDGYATDEWWAQRVYDFDGDKVRGLDEAIPLLVERARNLAAKETGKPPYTPLRNRIAKIVIGPPAAGKSTIANAIALRIKAAIADVDDAKTVIPEYQGGIGANAVHEESSAMGQEVLERLLVSGDNLVIPKVGHALGSIEKLRANLKAMGYSVELVLMDVKEETALNRMIKRFKRTGRLINPSYFLDVAARPPRTYAEAKRAGKFDGYSSVTSEDNVPTRVSEASGAATSLARGEIFERGGEIGTGRPVAGTGAGERAAAPEAKAKVSAEQAKPPAAKTKIEQVQGGQIIYALSPQFAAKADAVLATLRKALDKLGLTGVKLEVWQQIFADMERGAFGVDGVALKNLIHVSLTGRNDPDITLHHEAIHALINLGLFSPMETTILQRKSKKDWITDTIKANYPESQWVEEGIAHAYTDWLKGERMDGVVAKSFKKVKAFLKATYQSLTSNDIRTADDIFRQVTAGEIGRRSAASAAASQGQPAFATTETVDMFEGPREQYVIPGAEKLTDAQLAQRRADAKLQAKKPQKSVGALPLFGDQKDQLALFSIPPKQTTIEPGRKEADPADPRFAMTAPPSTSQQAQQTMQGFFNRGQAVDRALRLPFALLGGLDAQNRWSWGKRLTDKMGPAGLQGFGIGGVVGAGISTLTGVGPIPGFLAGGTVGAYILGSPAHPGGGRFGWFHNMAENAKRGLIDGYGLDPAYIDTYRKSELGKAAIQRQAQGIMKVLSNAGVGTHEAQVLQQILSGQPVNDAAMQRLAVPIRQAIDDLGAEAVSLGLISAESFQRNRGAYLHRVYAKNEVDQNTLAGWVSAKMATRRKKIIGDQLKGRGMFMDIEGDRLMRDVASFQSGKRGAAVLGEKFHVIDEVSSTQNLNPAHPPSQKTLRRVYLPANEAIPAKYQGPAWVDRGTWEVRKAGNKPTLWRDYTKAERDKMGEIVDARYTIAKTFMLMANDLSTGRFFRDVSVKQEWTQSTPPAAKWKEASEYSRFWNDPEIQWVKVPDTNIDQTGGKKRWGALAGKWVRSEIWRDLNEVNIANNPGTWRTLYAQWKRNKTARAPVTHMNNIMSNVAFMDLADVRTQDLVAGIKAYVSGGKDYQEALDNGAFGADMVSQEIRDQVFKPLLAQITQQSTGAQNPFLARAGVVGHIADKLWTWAKAADERMLRAYQAEDHMFRMATYMRRRSQGESPAVAAANARDQFLNYDIRAPWVVAARNSVLPFISYVYRAVPKLAENISHRPWKLAKYAAIAYAVNALAYFWDDKDEEDKERAALRDEEQGYTWLGSPRMMRMPFRDGNGLPVFLDIRRWIPAGDIFDTDQGSTALPIPAPLHFGGPLQMAFEFMLNRQSFTGEDITNDLTMDAGDKFSTVADWAWKSWAPGSFWTPRSWYWTKIANAIYGATDTAGHPYSVPQAVLSSIGIKVKPVDVEDGIMWHFYDFKKVQQALKKDLRANSRRLERGLISQSAHDSAAADIMDKFQRLGQRIDEFSERTRSKPKGE